MHAVLPLLAMGIPALLGAVSGGINIASAVKQLHGGRLRKGKGLSPMYIARPYAGSGVKRIKTNYRQQHKKKRGGKAKKGKGLSPMYISRPYAGCGLLAPAGRGLSPMYIARPYAGSGLKKRKRGGRMKKRGRGMLTPIGGHNLPFLKKLAMPSTSILTTKPYIVSKYEGGPFKAQIGEHMNKIQFGGQRGSISDGQMVPFIEPIIGTSDHGFRLPTQVVIPSKTTSRMEGLGLLAPAGRGLTLRKGHYRKGPHGQRVHVQASMVRSGGKLIKRKGHYRKGKGGKLIRIRPAKVHRQGKGVIADTLGSVPLLGALLGPIAKALGGKVRKGYKKPIKRRYKGGRHGNLHRMSTTINRVLSGGRIKRVTKARRGGYVYQPTWRSKVFPFQSQQYLCYH